MLFNTKGMVDAWLQMRENSSVKASDFKSRWVGLSLLVMFFFTRQNIRELKPAKPGGDDWQLEPRRCTKAHHPHEMIFRIP